MKEMVRVLIFQQINSLNYIKHFLLPDCWSYSGHFCCMAINDNTHSALLNPSVKILPIACVEQNEHVLFNIMAVPMFRTFFEVPCLNLVWVKEAVCIIFGKMFHAHYLNKRNLIC
jgi:hypothetical protein